MTMVQLSTRAVRFVDQLGVAHAAVNLGLDFRKMALEC
jgi:hypothetical protein